MRKFIFLTGFLIIVTCLNAQDTADYHRVYQSYEVDSLPAFPYGNDSLYAYLRSGLKDINPSECLGTMMVSFVVEIDGSVTEARIVRSVCPLADKRLLEVVYEMPTWKPAMFKGRKVKSQVNIPVKVYFSPPPENKQ